LSLTEIHRWNAPPADDSGDVTAHLHEVERPLALFAQGIAGTFFHIKSVDEFDGAEARGQALHDRGVLYLPEQIDRFHSRAYNLGTYKLMALHQLCHLEFGSYVFDIHEARARIPALADREMPAAGLTESDFDTFYRHFPVRWLVRHLFHVLEAARIDRRMLDRYPGARRYYERLAGLEVETRWPTSISDLSALLQALQCWALGADAKALSALDATGALAPLTELAEPARALDADVYRITAAVTDAYGLLEQFGLLPAPQSTATAIEAMDEPVAEEDTPPPAAFHGAPPTEWLQREERLNQWQDELEQMEAGLQMEMDAANISAVDDQALSQEQADNASTRAIDQKMRAQQRERDVLERRINIEQSRIDSALGRKEPHRGPSFLYDEWDYLENRYLPGWCRLYEEPALDTAEDQIRAMLNRVAPHEQGVRKRFEQIKPFAYQRVRRIVDGEDLDFDLLIDYQTERKRGQSPEDRVYTRRDRLHRDVAAAFLVDLSASTDDPIDKFQPPAEPAGADADSDEAPDPRSLNLRDPYSDDDEPAKTDDDEPPRRIIDVQREALLLMSQALETLGDPYAIYGFSGYGRDNVEFYVAKDFKDGFSYRTLGALAGMKPRRSTRMGPPIRHCSRKLTQAASALKVMIIISDGFPQDCDYGPDRSDHTYGVQDTAKALQEAQDAGIETFCITVDKSGHDYLKDMAPEARYMVIEDIEALPDALTKVYERLTAR
jgi:nitric oxide reductase NorD protein